MLAMARHCSVPYADIGGFNSEPRRLSSRSAHEELRVQLACTDVYEDSTLKEAFKGSVHVIHGWCGMKGCLELNPEAL